MERIVVVIVGPTCSGKTSLSLKLAGKLPAEIISADSRQVFQFLNIGTAKPNPDELRAVKHHFIDMLNPDQDFNASMFENLALQEIDSIFNKIKTPIVVGGSGLYISALIDGIFNTVDVDIDYRAELQKIRREKGNDGLYKILEEVDPVSASSMLPQNYKRVMRALEVFHLTGEPVWIHQQNYKRETKFIFKQFGLNWERKNLYDSIEARVDSMLESGLIKETEFVLDAGFSPSINSLNTVGYKEIISYLNGEYSLDRAVELIKRNTRRFAKRQMTWFRRDQRIKWFDVRSVSDLEHISDLIIKEIF